MLQIQDKSTATAMFGTGKLYSTYVHYMHQISEQTNNSQKYYTRERGSVEHHNRAALEIITQLQRPVQANYKPHK